MEKEDYLKGFDDAIDLFFNIVKDKIGLEKLRETGIVDIYLKLKDLTAQHKVKKFIYCSTCGVHGNIDNPPAGEDAPIQPADYYQRTK